MTPLREFFDRLPKDGWILSDNGCIRRPNKICCPATVAYPNGYKPEFLRICGRVYRAADDCCRTPTEKRIRRLLLKHCGLQERNQ